MPVRHTTLPSCSREAGNYHPPSDLTASRKVHRPSLADLGLAPSARGGVGPRRAALSPALPEERGIGAVRGQSPDGAFGSESFRKLRCAALGLIIGIRRGRDAVAAELVLLPAGRQE